MYRAGFWVIPEIGKEIRYGGNVDMEEKGKKLKTINIVGLGLGGAIGTGIFLLLGYGIAYTGRSIVLVCAIGCFFMLLAYWYQLAMPSMFVLKGGDYSMKTMLFSPVMSGISAFFTVVGGFAFSGYAIGVTDYLCVIIPGLKNYSTLCSLLIMTLAFAASIKGSRFITILENLVTILLVAALALFVVFGVTKVDAGNFFSSTYDGGFFRNGFAGVVAAIAVMGWACQGTTMAPISMAAVTEKPKRTIPKAILIVTLLLAVIYALMAYAASGVLPYDQVAGANISVTAEAIFPTGLYLFFVVGGGVGAIVSSLLGGIGMMRYPMIKIAEDGWMPAIFKKSTKSGYPYVTYLLFYIISIFPILTGMGLDSVVSLVMIPTMLMNIYMNLACITLPKKYPEQWEKRSLRMPVWFWNVCCVLGAFCAGVVAYNLFVELTFTDSIICIIIVVALIGLSALRLKQGAVSKEQLAANKKMIIEQAIADDVD